MNKSMSKRVVSLVILGTMVGTQMVYAVDTVQKDESVFVTLAQNGSEKEKIVSEWLHSDNKNVDIKDRSELKNIKNIKGEEQPSINGQDLTWKSDNNDIYYQGQSEKELPLEVKIDYYMNGTKVEPKDIAGKSGKLKIEFSIVNKDGHKVEIDGKERTIYTPFMAASIINLPLENFKNVKISSGELIADANNQIVAFVSLPGIKESLDVDTKDLDINLDSKLVIESDVTDFEMGPIMVTATPKLPDELKKFKEAKDLDELTDGLKELKDATSKLVDGTGKLSEGAKLLDSKVGILNSSYGSLNSGINTLNSGAKELYSGSTSLKNGASELNGGIGLLSSEFNNVKGKLPTLLGQAEQLSKGTSQLKAGNAQLAENMAKLEAGTKKAADASKALSAGADKLSNGLGQLEKEVVGGLTAQEQVMGSVMKDMAIVDTNINALKSTEEGKKLLAQLNSSQEGKKLIDTLQVLEKSKATMDKLKPAEGEASTKDKVQGAVSELKKGADQLKGGTESLGNNLDVLATNMTKTTSAAKQLADGAKQVSDGVDKVMSSKDSAQGKLNKLESAIVALNNGSKALKDGSSKLNNGLGSLCGGSDTLKSGSTKVYEGIGALKNGTSTLASKTVELNEATKKYEKDGILKMDNKVQGALTDVKDIIKVKDEIVKLSDEYNSFAGIGDGMQGKVKFIMKTDEIEKPKVEEKDKKEEVKEGIFQKIKNFFNKDK